MNRLMAPQLLFTEQQQRCPGYSPEVRIIRIVEPPPRERRVLQSNTAF